MKENFKRKLWIGFGIVFGSIVIASVALYFLSGDLNAQAAAIFAQKTSDQSQTQAVANLATLKSTAPAAARYEAAMERLLPDQFGLVGFGQWLDQVGSQYGVTATFSFQGNPSTPAPGTLGSAPFSLTAQGSSIQGLTAFLENIESQAPGFLLSISSFDLTGGANPSLTAQGVLFFR
jgi:hypothetical protein